jgi:4-hydroxy-tetrahydrodipicolinate reductase
MILRKAAKIVLIGAGGKMGRFTETLLDLDAELELVARISSADDAAAGLQGCGADVGLDFTVAGRGAQHARLMLEAGIRPLIGTSGVQPAEVEELDALANARGLGGLVVPNFCLGIWLQQKLAREAARYFDTIEIIEEHHHAKQDAPSGTAADTARRLSEVEPRSGVRSSIPIHSLRLRGLCSNQTVLMGGPGEVLRLAHETYGLEAFGPGILAGLRYVATAAGVQVGIEHAFAARSRRDA